MKSPFEERELSENEKMYPLSHGGVVVYAANTITEIYPAKDMKYVYFIMCKEMNAVKIGVASDYYARLNELQTGCAYKLHLTAIVTGGYQKEAELHRRYAHLRMEGEWFRLGDELLGLILGLRQSLTDQNLLIGAIKEKGI